MHVFEAVLPMTVSDYQCPNILLSPICTGWALMGMRPGMPGLRAFGPPRHLLRLCAQQVLDLVGLLRVDPNIDGLMAHAHHGIVRMVEGQPVGDPSRAPR